jgi:hypothetical protein
LSIADLAARVVEVGIETGSGQPVVIGFDSESLINRLGMDCVIESLQRLPLDEAVGRLEGADVSWANRRRRAVTMLASSVETLRNSLLPLMPRLPKGVPQPFINHGVDVLDAPNSEVPDLKVSVTVLAPAALSVPTTHDDAPGPVGAEREGRILAELARSRINRWLQNAPKSGWSLTARPWEITDPGDGRRITRATAQLRSDDDAPISGWRQQTPILTGAQIRTGAADPEGGSPFMVADFAIGLWLVELTAERRPANRRFDSRPLPAALSLAEMYALLTEVVTGAVESTASLYERLTERTKLESSMIVRVAIEAGLGIDAVVDLTGERRAGSGGSRSVHLAHHFESEAGGDTARMVARAKDWVTALMDDWLLQSGYRNYEDSLLRLSAAVDEPEVA